MTESFCCTAEITTTLEITYIHKTLKKKRKKNANSKPFTDVHELRIRVDTEQTHADSEPWRREGRFWRLGKLGTNHVVGTDLDALPGLPVVFTATRRVRKK